MSDLFKSHVEGYTRADGVYVKSHSRKGGDAIHPEMAHHPRRGEDGKPVVIKKPSTPTGHSTWHNPKEVATFTPEGDTPPSLNGVPLSRWHDHPKDNDGWEYADGVNDDLDEPPFHLPVGKTASSGVIIEESDGRVWVIHPTNSFGGYDASFPKGGVEEELSMQANALKECYEESGLKVKITGFIGDFTRTTSVARFYKAERVGGCPSAMGWETQAVSLVPKDQLLSKLNMWSDHAIAEKIIDNK